MLTVVVCPQTNTYTIVELSPSETKHLPSGWELFEGREEEAMRAGYQKRNTPSEIFRIPTKEAIRKCSL